LAQIRRLSHSFSHQTLVLFLQQLWAIRAACGYHAGAGNLIEQIEAQIRHGSLDG